MTDSPTPEAEESSEDIADPTGSITARLEQLEAVNSELRAGNERLRERMDELAASVAATPVRSNGEPGDTEAVRGQAANTNTVAGQTASVDSGPGTAENGPETAVSDGGESFKVVGELDVESGVGVLGQNGVPSGTATGVRGVVESESSDATGVSGRARAADVQAATRGVEGVTDADANNGPTPEIIPAGVAGRATGENVTHGVTGRSESIKGRGVTGFTTSAAYDHSSFAGSGIGVSGITDLSGDDDDISDAGGVFGYATADSGTAYGVVGRTNSPDGWGVRGMDMSGAGYGVFSHGDSKTQGDHETTGDTDLGGELALADGTSQRTAGPVAKGFVDTDGTIVNAVNLDSATWDSTEQRYYLSLVGENYWFDEYATVITPLFDSTVRVTSRQGDMAVEIRDGDGTLIQSGFQFVTFALPDGTETTTTSVDTNRNSDDTDHNVADSGATPEAGRSSSGV